MGLSRGGIGALMLAKRLSHLDDASVDLALCLYDPVPGNLITTVKYVDPFFGRMTTAASVVDVSHTPVKRVLALYPYEPLPDLAFHAPLVPCYPPACVVEEDATLGCHQGALYPPRRVPTDMQPACLLSRERLLTFLHSEGVQVSDEWRSPAHDDAGRLARACLDICEAELRQATPSVVRAAHTPPGSHAAIVRHAGHGGATLLNGHHRRLLEALRPADARLTTRGGGGAAAEDAPRYLLEVARSEPAGGGRPAASPSAKARGCVF